jgi:hypothetical protein
MTAKGFLAVVFRKRAAPTPRNRIRQTKAIILLRSFIVMMQSLNQQERKPKEKAN